MILICTFSQYVVTHHITLHYMLLIRCFYPKRLTYSKLWAIPTGASWGEASCPGTQRHADCSGVWTCDPLILTPAHNPLHHTPIEGHFKNHVTYIFQVRLLPIDRCWRASSSSSSASLGTSLGGRIPFFLRISFHSVSSFGSCRKKLSNYDCYSYSGFPLAWIGYVCKMISKLKSASFQESKEN